MSLVLENGFCPLTQPLTQGSMHTNTHKSTPNLSPATRSLFLPLSLSLRSVQPSTLPTFSAAAAAATHRATQSCSRPPSVRPSVRRAGGGSGGGGVSVGGLCPLPYLPPLFCRKVAPYRAEVPDNLGMRVAILFIQNYLLTAKTHPEKEFVVKLQLRREIMASF